jgi:hypothetical protein
MGYLIEPYASREFPINLKPDPFKNKGGRYLCIVSVFYFEATKGAFLKTRCRGDLFDHEFS